MKKRSNYLPINIILSNLICLLLSSCISYKQVELKEIKEVSLVNNDIYSGKVMVNLRVANPNNYSIKIKKYDIHAFLNGMDMGLIGVEEKIVLPKNSDKDYTLTFQADASKILGALPTLMFSGGGEAALKGSVKAKAFLFSKTFPVDLKKRISAEDFR